MAAGDAWGQLRRLPVQSNGRVKPLDTFARETVRMLTGDERYGGEDPLKTVLSIAADSASWEEKPMLSVPYRPLRRRLEMDPDATHHSYAKIFQERKLMPLLPPLVEKQRRGDPLTSLEKETNDLYLRLVAFHDLTTREAFQIVPASEGEVWSAPGPDHESWNRLLDAIRRRDNAAFAAAAEALIQADPPSWRMNLEVLYNQIHPFRWGWIGYGLASILLALGFRFKKLQRAGLALFGGTLLFNVGGLIVRIVLAGRPPVTNLYESMLWLVVVMAALAGILERSSKRGYVVLAASVMGMITLLLADQLPFEPGINPIVAVLRSSLWLTIHVLTIVASYGALALAAGVAHLACGMFLAGRPGGALAQVYQLMYRVIQVAVILLAAGIMLGALWANASWGRYWGWDPKETWALITLLWYVAVLHGRYAGWIRGIGFPVATIGGFLLLLMTYYGVNYFLVGLHSYAGGHATRPLPPLLLIYLVLEGLFVASVAAVARRKPPRAG
ncbi:MAG: cytochrome c biogenesis protein CcsA [Candidatus Omnitrophica bacterium]|nr:cytochrome c biogenesis protein CcsA [Candidatus Omnitrophota bacterium]